MKETKEMRSQGVTKGGEESGGEARVREGRTNM